jgi:tRNA splicing endonuclease
MDQSTRDEWEEKVKIVRTHFEQKGYRVHSGLQFGCELVLYADDPQRVHSDFCVHVVREGKLCTFVLAEESKDRLLLTQQFSLLL